MKRACFATFFAIFCCVLHAAPEKNAVVTEAKGQVFLGDVAAASAERPAAVKDTVDEKNYVRTAVKSRAELEFSNETITRLGSLTVFRFAPESSNYILKRGEALFVFPKGKGGATVTTAALSAGILGTTVYVKAERGTVEYVCLEGRCQIGPHVLEPGEKLVIRGSRPAYAVPKEKFSIERFLRENELINSFAASLPSLPLIEEEARKQRGQ
jgi:ferric-dicitrate binding protein FerR (iron transport regulator)